MADSVSFDVTKDNVSSVLRAIQKMAGKRLLVGVPSSRVARETDDPLNNAEIGYISEFGAPEANIPARPSLVPGVTKILPRALRALQRGARKALEGDEHAIEDALNATGLLAIASVKQTITDNIPPPLAPSTIANRYKQRRTKKRRANEEAYLASIKGKDGLSPGEAQQLEGIVALINTGQFRNSITYVIRDDDK